MAKPKTATAPTLDLRKWEGAVLIPLTALVTCPWNVNEMGDAEFSELVSEIETGGFDEPLDVVPTKDDPNLYLVLGGEHRYKAVTALEWNEVPCVIKTALIGASEADLMQWSVKRNNIRGKINAQKFAELERTLSERHNVKIEAARSRMLLKGELLKSLKKNEAVRDNEQAEEAKNPKAAREPSGDGTSAELDAKATVGARKNLLASLKTAEEEVLLQCPDTVEHGYLYFGQNGKTHLVVDASHSLANLVKRAVAACKANSDKIDELIATALAAEIPKWE